jgi:hypothetical protein
MNEITKARSAPAIEFGETVLRLLADPKIPAEKLQILLQMQMQVLEDARREAFNAAYAGMSLEMPQIEKRGVVELVKDGKILGRYKYLKFEDQDAVVRPILNKHGFGMSFYTGAENGQPVIYGELLHRDGYSKRGFLPLVPDRGPGRNDLQAEGSALSYQKRYLQEMLCNIVRKGADDDGIAGGSRPISQGQVKELVELLADTGTKTEVFLRLFVTGIETLEGIPARDFARLKNALQEKKASLLKGKKT